MRAVADFRIDRRSRSPSSDLFQAWSWIQNPRDWTYMWLLVSSSCMLAQYLGSGQACDHTDLVCTSWSSKVACKAGPGPWNWLGLGTGLSPCLSLEPGNIWKRGGSWSWDYLMAILSSRGSSQGFAIVKLFDKKLTSNWWWLLVNFWSNSLPAVIWGYSPRDGKNLTFVKAGFRRNSAKFGEIPKNRAASNLGQVKMHIYLP